MRTAEQLKNDVEQELRWEPSIDATQIGVSIKNGVVELDGHVGTLHEKWIAECAALRVANVTSIASEIIVDLSSSAVRTDADIALAVTNQLTWNSLIPDTIKVKVCNGSITLEGTVEWHYQRVEAERAVRPLLGVKHVLNQLHLKPTVSAIDVKSRIEGALERDAQIEAGHIMVETAGSAVTLRGSVQSWTERQHVEKAAFDAPGVASVANLIEIC